MHYDFLCDIVVIAPGLSESSTGGESKRRTMRHLTRDERAEIVQLLGAGVKQVHNVTHVLPISA